MAKFLLLIFSFEIILIMVSCAPQESKSLKHYSQLQKQLLPSQTQLPRIQTLISSDVYSITVDAPIEFKVGINNELKIHSQLNLPGASYRLVILDAPRNSKPLMNLGAGDWLLEWNPSADLIPNNLYEVQGGFHISIELISANDPQTQTLFNNISTETLFNYRLIRQQEVPEIVEIKGVAIYPQLTQFTHGSSPLYFSILVKDTAASLHNPPQLFFKPTPLTTTGEKQIISAHIFVSSLGEPQLLASGLWEFKLSFDTIHYKQQLNTSKLGANYDVQILSPNKITSASHKITFEITFPLEIPPLEKATDKSKDLNEIKKDIKKDKNDDPKKSVTQIGGAQ